MRINIKQYLEVHNLTIYQVSKRSGYGYTTLHKSFNKPQSVSYTHLRAHETRMFISYAVFCLKKKKTN